MFRSLFDIQKDSTSNFKMNLSGFRLIISPVSTIFSSTQGFKPMPHDVSRTTFLVNPFAKGSYQFHIFFSHIRCSEITQFFNSFCNRICVISHWFNDPILWFYLFNYFIYYLIAWCVIFVDYLKFRDIKGILVLLDVESSYMRNGSNLGYLIE